MTTSPLGISAPNLAFSYQEIFTICARLRLGKAAVGDSAIFRIHLRKSLQLAENAAHGLGYEAIDIKLASYAAISLLDETVLNSSNPVFQDWARKPLMLDLYNTLTAGNGFFENLRSIETRKESGSTIDLLEVYGLALLLGFRGRYSAPSDEQIRALRDPIFARIYRHRYFTGQVELSRSWLPEAVVQMPPQSNRMTSVMTSVLMAFAAVSIVLYVVYVWLLSRGVSDLSAAADRLGPN